MPCPAAGSEDALEQARLALFRQMGWDTVNCMDEVLGDMPASPPRSRLLNGLCGGDGRCT